MPPKQDARSRDDEKEQWKKPFEMAVAIAPVLNRLLFLMQSLSRFFAHGLRC